MAAAQIPRVTATTKDRGASAKYDDKARRFQHSINLFAHEPFRLKEIILQEPGDYAGHKAYIAVRDPCFPFEKLPLELRQAIYKLVFRTGEDVSIDSRLFRDMGNRQTLASKYRTPVIVSPRDAPRYSLVLANHMISEEATEFLYSGRHFVFGTTANLKNWLKMIGDCAKFVTSLEVRRTGAQQTSHVYLQLSAATNLRYLCITLPLSPSSDTLDVHIDKHWSHLKHFLLASYASEAKAMARLDAIHFRVGKEQGGVLGSDGKPMRAITSAKNAWCRERIRGHLRKHFAHAK